MSDIVKVGLTINLYLKWTTSYLYYHLSFSVGMSDLCSPMIILLDDEADAFWAFERLMRRLVLSPCICLFIYFF